MKQAIRYKQGRKTPVKQIHIGIFISVIDIYPRECIFKKSGCPAFTMVDIF